MCECICRFYHSEDNACGFNKSLDCHEDDDICVGPECSHNSYKEATYQYGYEPNVMIDEHGNINWRLAFRMP